MFFEEVGTKPGVHPFEFHLCVEGFSFVDHVLVSLTAEDRKNGDDGDHHEEFRYGHGTLEAASDLEGGQGFHSTGRNKEQKPL